MISWKLEVWIEDDPEHVSGRIHDDRDLDSTSLLVAETFGLFRDVSRDRFRLTSRVDDRPPLPGVTHVLKTKGAAWLGGKGSISERLGAGFRGQESHFRQLTEPASEIGSRTRGGLHGDRSHPWNSRR